MFFHRCQQARGAHVNGGTLEANPRRLWSVCFLLAPFAEAVTGFGVGYIIALAALRRLGLGSALLQVPIHVFYLLLYWRFARQAGVPVPAAAGAALLARRAARLSRPRRRAAAQRALRRADRGALRHAAGAAAARSAEAAGGAAAVRQPAGLRAALRAGLLAGLDRPGRAAGGARAG